MFLNKILKEDSLIVFVDTDIELIKTRFSERKTIDKVKAHELSEVQRGFRKAMETIPHVKYESNDNTALKRIVQELESYLKN